MPGVEREVLRRELFIGQNIDIAALPLDFFLGQNQPWFRRADGCSVMI